MIDAGNLMDGFSHWLAVARSTELVYLVQRGGLPDTQTVLGPFHARNGCRGSPTSEPAWTPLGKDAR
jgi:hypothetical protein